MLFEVSGLAIRAEWPALAMAEATSSRPLASPQKVLRSLQIIDYNEEYFQDCSPPIYFTVNLIIFSC
jgi:hypothetical protein